MHSVTLSTGKPVATLHVLLTPPWSDRKLVSVQETKGTLNRSQLSPFSRLLLKIKHSAHKQLSAMDNASTGLSCVLDHVRKINGQVSGSTLCTDTDWPGTPGTCNSKLFLTTDQHWADALDASLRLRLAQLRTILEERDNPLRIGTISCGVAAGSIPAEDEVEQLSAPEYSVETMFYKHTEEALFHQAGVSDFPIADCIHWAKELQHWRGWQ